MVSLLTLLPDECLELFVLANVIKVSIGFYSLPCPCI